MIEELWPAARSAIANNRAAARIGAFENGCFEMRGVNGTRTSAHEIADENLRVK
jgi:hypothetical protein